MTGWTALGMHQQPHTSDKVHIQGLNRETLTLTTFTWFLFISVISDIFQNANVIWFPLQDKNSLNMVKYLLSFPSDYIHKEYHFNCKHMSKLLELN